MRKHIHLGAYVILHDDNSLILIRKSRGAYTGKLDLPGGTIEHGESPIEAAKREVEEEAGISINSIELVDAISKRTLWKDIDDDEDLHHVGIIYKSKCDNVNLKNDSDGLDSLGASWYKINNVKEEELSPFAYYAIQLLKK
jgi:mutator protein MutT